MWYQILETTLMTDLSQEQQEMIVAGASVLDNLNQETNDVVNKLGLTPPAQDKTSTVPTIPTASKDKSAAGTSQTFLDRSPFKNSFTIPI